MHFVADGTRVHCTQVALASRARNHRDRQRAAVKAASAMHARTAEWAALTIQHAWWRHQARRQPPTAPPTVPTPGLPHNHTHGYTHALYCYSTAARNKAPVGNGDKSDFFETTTRISPTRLHRHRPESARIHRPRSAGATSSTLPSVARQAYRSAVGTFRDARTTSRVLSVVCTST